MRGDLKTPPPYAIASVDHALRLAVVLQLEGSLTVSAAAQRLGVARSTAHRLLAMLVYRDFAVQEEDRTYRAGPVLQLAVHSRSATSRLRAAALPHLQTLVDLVGETANLTVRAGDTGRFIASVEGGQALRVGNREGMVFPAHQLTGGLVLLSELTGEQLDSLYAPERFTDRLADRPDPAELRADLEKVRTSGFALNRERSEKGVVAIGSAVRDSHGMALAGVSLSLPSVRYTAERLPSLVAALALAARAIEADLAPTPGGHHIPTP